MKITKKGLRSGALAVVEDVVVETGGGELGAVEVLEEGAVKGEPVQDQTLGGGPEVQHDVVVLEVGLVQELDLVHVKKSLAMISGDERRLLMLC